MSANAHETGLGRLAPGLMMLRGYQSAWLRYDVAAGLSVAAVALPTAIAYAQLAGFPPVVGLYASIAPLVVYAVLGTSRQLIVNPDAATCAMVAAIVAPLAAGNSDLYTTLAVALAVMSGIACVIAGFFRLGFLADFLGKPCSSVSPTRCFPVSGRPSRHAKSGCRGSGSDFPSSRTD